MQRHYAWESHAPPTAGLPNGAGLLAASRQRQYYNTIHHAVPLQQRAVLMQQQAAYDAAIAAQYWHAQHVRLQAQSDAPSPAEPSCCQRAADQRQPVEGARLGLHDQEESEAISTCSTAPSMPPRRRSRASAARRRFEAQMLEEAKALAAQIIGDKSTITDRIKAGGETSDAAIKEIAPAVWQLSQDADGCRIVQAAMDMARGALRGLLVEPLRGHVREAIGSPYANYVIQKVVVAMPVEIANFVAKELMGMAPAACKHRYGCRVMCRLIEQFGNSPAVTKLVHEMMTEIAELILHQFGCHVVEVVLEHGLKESKHLIAEQLLQDVHRFASSRNGSHVLERAVRQCSDEDIELLAKEIAELDVLALAKTQYGVFVVRAITESSTSSASAVAEKVRMAPDAEPSSKHFKRLQELLASADDDTETRPTTQVSGSANGLKALH